MGTKALSDAEGRLVVATNFSRIYLGGIPSLLNDDGAFMSFICCLTAMEALGGFIAPKLGNGPRFKTFVKMYMPAPLCDQADELWRFRNAAVHGFSPGPDALTHHSTHVHLAIPQGAHGPKRRGLLRGSCDGEQTLPG